MMKTGDEREKEGNKKESERECVREIHPQGRSVIV